MIKQNPSGYRYILHIGRHKTGTSALQTFLSENAEALAAAGFYYPETGRNGFAHHPIAALLMPHSSGANDEFSMGQLRREIGDRRLTALLSSEALQHVPPETAAEWFPRNETGVIVYLREQADYARSAYSQFIQARFASCDIGSYARFMLEGDYYSFLSRWIGVYGKANVLVRIYDRDLLINSNIIEDFLDALGIAEKSGFRDIEHRRNPSIGGVMLRLKRLLNRACLEHHEAMSWFDPVALFHVIEGASQLDPRFTARIALPPGDTRAIVEKYRDSNRRVLAEYTDGGGSRLFAVCSGGRQAETRTEFSEDDYRSAIDAIAETDRETAGTIFRVIRRYVAEQAPAGSKEVLRRMADCPPGSNSRMQTLAQAFKILDTHEDTHADAEADMIRTAAHTHNVCYPARVLQREGRLDEAVAMAEKALRLFPSSAEAKACLDALRRSGWSQTEAG